MKYIQLDKSEQKILNDFEKGEFIDIDNVEEEKKRYQEYAANTINKTKNINICLSIRDIHKLKAQAIENGLPYQTLIAAILHQYANKKINANL